MKYRISSKCYYDEPNKRKDKIGIKHKENEYFILQIKPPFIISAFTQTATLVALYWISRRGGHGVKLLIISPPVASLRYTTRQKFSQGMFSRLEKILDGAEQCGFYYGYIAVVTEKCIR